MSNKSLKVSKKNPNDEFYTLYEDIEKELVNYKDEFKNKVVYCNCDDYNKSNFVKFFKNNFNFLKIKKLISSSYKSKEYFIKDETNEKIEKFYTFGKPYIKNKTKYCRILIKKIFKK